jgi:Icc-related predicted phosphoesterase
MNLEVCLPADIPPDFFDLVAIPGEAEVVPEIYPGAIKILRDSGTGLRVVHLTDVHFEDTPEKTERFQEAVEAINLIDPDLILCSGDLMTRANEGEMKELSRHFAALESPVFFAPGNHDHGHMDLFLSYFSRDRYYSFDAGDYHFVALDTGGPLGFLHHHRGQGMEPEQLAWLEEDLRTAGGRSIYVFLHYSPVLEKDTFSDGREEFLKLMRSYRVKAILAGHVHRDAVFDLSGDDRPASSYGEVSVPVVHTTTLSSRRTRGKGHGFRYLILTPEGIAGSSPFESLPLGSLSVSCGETGVNGPACRISNATGGVIGGVRVDVRWVRPASTPPLAHLLWEMERITGPYRSYTLDLPPGETLLRTEPAAP